VALRVIRKTILQKRGDEMGTFLGLISVIAICGSVLTLTMLILVALPQSKIRAALLQVFGWVFAAFCLIYFISPVDVLPEAILGPFLGLFDDAAAVMAGVAAARAAWRAGKDKAAMAAKMQRLEIE
jgi:uncharacterized membrane protein YkvA (DUF1232 family)